MTTNNPSLWNNIIRELQPYFPDSLICIAGGAVRDNALGVAPKDIDVFISIEDELDFEFGLLGMEESGLYPELREFDSDLQEDYLQGNHKMEDMLYIYEYEHLGYPIQIIGCRFTDPDDLIKRFDFHIVQCYHTLDGTVLTKECRRDLKKRTFTLVHSENKPRSIDRFHRFANRNPQLKVALKDIFVEKSKKAWINPLESFLAKTDTMKVRLREDGSCVYEVIPNSIYDEAELMGPFDAEGRR